MAAFEPVKCVECGDGLLSTGAIMVDGVGWIHPWCNDRRKDKYIKELEERVHFLTTLCIRSTVEGWNEKRLMSVLLAGTAVNSVVELEEGENHVSG